MKKILTVTLLFCLLVCCTSPAAYANSPGPNMDGTYDSNPAAAVLLIGAVVVIYLMVTVFTCWLEWVISGPFGLRDAYQKTILITNLITQLIMHLIEFLSLRFQPETVGNTMLWYLLTVLVLEVLVYISEFLIYRKKMPDIPNKQILLYTVCANTASLLGGVLLLFII